MPKKRKPPPSRDTEAWKRLNIEEVKSQVNEYLAGLDLDVPFKYYFESLDSPGGENSYQLYVQGLGLLFIFDNEGFLQDIRASLKHTAEWGCFEKFHGSIFNYEQFDLPKERRDIATNLKKFLMERTASSDSGDRTYSIKDYEWQARPEILGLVQLTYSRIFRALEDGQITRFLELVDATEERANKILQDTEAAFHSRQDREIQQHFLTTIRERIETLENQLRDYKRLATNARSAPEIIPEIITLLDEIVSEITEGEYQERFLELQARLEEELRQND